MTIYNPWERKTWYLSIVELLVKELAIYAAVT